MDKTVKTTKNGQFMAFLTIEAQARWKAEDLGNKGL